MYSPEPDKGFTLVEVLLAITIMAIVSVFIANSLRFIGTQTIGINDRAFASQKVVQMMEELRGLITGSGSDSAGLLDNYDDGNTCPEVLTTRREITDRADPVSGNGSGRFCRRVSVIKVPDEPLARRVYVRVYRASTRENLAEAISILRTVSNEYSPTQGYDVYVIAIENVPGWWSAMSTMRPMFDSVIQDLQVRNPGLQIRAHWITRLAYGRDPYYRPYTNSLTYTNSSSPPWVYFYPGKMTRTGGDFNYYDPGNFEARMNVDGATANPDSYSLADQYNNAVRYPDEEDLYSQAVSAAQSGGTAVPEMSLRMLLEKMNSDSASLKNLLLMNLHGELLPVPPIRNYSDSARKPDFPTQRNWRVVTHPGYLKYPSGGQVSLRLYSYVTNPDSVAENAVVPLITVLIKDTSLLSSNITVRECTGNSGTNYAWGDAAAGTDYTVSPSLYGAVVTIYNSPLRHALKTSAPRGGLPSSKRLYGLEYIPCEVGNPGTPEFPEGVKDLTMNNQNAYKNTARWVIKINAGALSNGRYTVETRIGNDLTTGARANQPYNLSRTYVWVGQDPPVTEQYQFTGDPRHMPYSDVKRYHGYNWYFKAIPSGDFEGFTKTVDGWDGGGGLLNVDVPRFFQLYRSGLLSTGGIWTTMTGFSFYYMGLGGEMGADASNGFPDGLPVVRTPWSPGSSAQSFVDEITDATANSNERVIAKTDNSWLSLFWLGELFPDNQFDTWSADGNLPVGPGNFYRAPYTTFNTAYGLGFNPVKRTQEKGSAAFINGNPNGSGNNCFTHQYQDSNTGSVTSTGTAIAAAFNFPLLSSILAARPFTIKYGGNDRLPPEWNDNDYSSKRTRTAVTSVYYDSDYQPTDYDADATVKVTSGTNAAYFVVNGISQQINFGAAQIGKLAVINMLRSYMEAGHPSITTGHISQVPLVTITSPLSTDEIQNPATLQVLWSLAWNRWDGQKYTENYPAVYTDTATVYYNLKYSNNNGSSWYFANTSVSAQADVPDAGRQVTSPFSWEVGGFPRGNYLIRIEAYRQNFPLHRSYHQRQIYIERL